MASEDLQPDGGGDLQNRLRRLYRHQASIPPEVDRAIIGTAARRIANLRRFHAVLKWSGGIAAAAAIVLVSLRLAMPGMWHNATPRAGQVARNQPRQIHVTGQVNMLDAYLLAREIRSGRKVPGDYDLNHDGKLDQADVDELAQRAVSLRGRP